MKRKPADFEHVDSIYTCLQRDAQGKPVLKKNKPQFINLVQLNNGELVSQQELTERMSPEYLMKELDKNWEHNLDDSMYRKAAEAHLVWDEKKIMDK